MISVLSLVFSLLNAQPADAVVGSPMSIAEQAERNEHMGAIKQFRCLDGDQDDDGDDRQNAKQARIPNYWDDLEGDDDEEVTEADLQGVKTQQLMQFAADCQDADNQVQDGESRPKQGNGRMVNTEKLGPMYIQGRQFENGSAQQLINFGNKGGQAPSI